MKSRQARVLFCLGACGLVCALITPYVPAQEIPGRCEGLDRPDHFGRFVARADLLRRTGTVDGNELLAIVNRTPRGALSPDFRPDDLVDIRTMRPAHSFECVPPRKMCLRREAALAFSALRAAMRRARLQPYVSSAFRAYRVQCATLLGAAEHEPDGLCTAAIASALPGHSQHQLGTAIDLFTRQWAEEGDRFREGFGCTEGGRWIAEHAHDFGFVLPYPLHPDYRQAGSSCAALVGAEPRLDPRTGYRYEPWHLRYVGVEHARAYQRAWLASGPGTANEITLEQWLRARRGERDAINAPVCDGCNCDRCATFATRDAPCERPALRLDERGRPLAPAGPPTLLDARLSRENRDRVLLIARVAVPQNTLTQPPLVTPNEAVFVRGEGAPRIARRRPRTYHALPGTWRLAIGLGERNDWPWRAALVPSHRDATDNGDNARIPAPPGEIALAVPIEGVEPGTLLRVGIASSGEVRDVARLRSP